MILADTGFWVALANPRDVHHGVARAVLEKLTEPLVTTWPVLTETCYLLLTRLDPRAQTAFLAAAAAGSPRVVTPEDSHLPRMVDLVERYRDQPMDLADASLVVLAEDLGTGRVLSTDRRDFATYRWKRTRRFVNVLPVP